MKRFLNGSTDLFVLIELIGNVPLSSASLRNWAQSFNKGRKHTADVLEHGLGHLSVTHIDGEASGNLRRQYRGRIATRFPWRPIFHSRPSRFGDRVFSLRLRSAPHPSTVVEFDSPREIEPALGCCCCCCCCYEQDVAFRDFIKDNNR